MQTQSRLSRNSVSLNSIGILVTLSCLSLFVVSPALASGSSLPDSGATKKLLHGALEQNEMIDQLEILGIKCIVKQGVRDSLSVQDVRMGSSAFFKGVDKGDNIRSLLKASADTYALTFERKGQVYQVLLKAMASEAESRSILKAAASENQKNVTLKSDKPTLASQSMPVVNVGPNKIPVTDVPMTKVPIEDVTGTKPPIIDVPTDPDKEKDKKLVKYDIELIIDISGSMDWHDGTGAMSKFDWCHNQVRALAQRLAPYKKTLTITTFNRSYLTMDNCSPSEVESIYARTHPEGGTNLVAPLAARLDHALLNRPAGANPTLIAVITDGLPNIPSDPHVVNTALINATRVMAKEDDVIVTFLQIGDTFDGRDFCVDLDDNLVNEGAKYDIVDTKTFADLKSEGLIDALIDAILEKKAAKRIGVPRPRRSNYSSAHQKNVELEKQIKDQKDERKRVEEELLK